MNNSLNNNLNTNTNANANANSALLSQQQIIAMNSTQKVAALLILLGPTTASEVLKILLIMIY